MIGRAALALATCALAGQALADAPASSYRPTPRPPVSVDADAAVTMALRTDRPVAAAAAGRVAAPKPPRRVVLAASGSAVRLSPRPDARPDNLQRRGVVRASGFRLLPNLFPQKREPAGICGVSAIKGSKLQPIQGRLRGCGVANPVRVTSVSGVVLSTPSTMDCRTATALNAWVAGAVKPAVGRLGGGVAGLKVAAHYSCRPRNNQRGAKISEHGKGRAIDISAIILKNGQALTVLRGWRDKTHGKILKALHRSACGPFGTVLGPNANRYHQDHFHFDTARYRSGSYCR